MSLTQLHAALRRKQLASSRISPLPPGCPSKGGDRAQSQTSGWFWWPLRHLLTPYFQPWASGTTSLLTSWVRVLGLNIKYPVQCMYWAETFSLRNREDVASASSCTSELFLGVGPGLFSLSLKAGSYSRSLCHLGQAGVLQASCPYQWQWILSCKETSLSFPEGLVQGPNNVLELHKQYVN